MHARQIRAPVPDICRFAACVFEDMGRLGSIGRESIVLKKPARGIVCQCSLVVCCCCVANLETTHDRQSPPRNNPRTHPHKRAPSNQRPFRWKQARPPGRTKLPLPLGGGSHPSGRRARSSGQDLSPNAQPARPTLARSLLKPLSPQFTATQSVGTMWVHPVNPNSIDPCGYARGRRWALLAAWGLRSWDEPHHLPPAPPPAPIQESSSQI